MFINEYNKYSSNDCSVPGSFLGVGGRERDRESALNETKPAVKELTF